MRIDKFLWCIRVCKTRSQAALICKTDKVKVNQELVKPSRELRVNDVITVRKGPIFFSYQVLAFPPARLGAKLVPGFAQDITPTDELKKLELLKLQYQNERPRGLGRPTKKERRDLDDYTDFDFSEFEDGESV
ncbi:MAG: RNA-binding S4 domain-containing protein [Flavobacteriales bacterium]|nr:RNA-binding S4 domain-containing protein [Flavobacteriales bacterium]